MDIINKLYELNNKPVSELPIVLWLILAVLLFTQASWIFFNASKNNRNKWLWGFFGLLNFPSSLILYLIFTKVLFKNTKNK